MRRKIVAGNWKLHGTRAFATALVEGVAAGAPVPGVELVVLPPLPYLGDLIEDFEGTALVFGAQDVSCNEQGAYTGEVSGTQLSKLGVSYVAVGHSERRQYHGETDAIVAAKTKAAFEHGIVPIVCVGEGLDIRKAGEHVSYTLAQVDGALEGLPAEQAKDVVIAYEPVWAIGTGRHATPAQAGEAHAHIRARLRQWFGAPAADQCHVLYGGSVKPDNIADLIAQPDVDGALVGGASLDVQAFHDIIVRSRPRPV